MSVDTDTPDDEETNIDYKWRVSEDGTHLTKQSYSTYVFENDTVRIEFDDVRDGEEGDYELRDGHEELAQITVEGTIASVMNVLRWEL